MNKCLCKPAKCLLTALVALAGTESHCSIIKGAQGCSAERPFPALIRSQTKWRRVQIEGGSASSWSKGMWEPDRFADTSHLHLEWKERKSTRQPVLEGRTSGWPILFSLFKVSATTCQRSQATVPDGSGVSDSSSGLLQCLHVTSTSRTAKIKQVIASRTTRKETQKHVSTWEKVSASCHTPAPSTGDIQGKREKRAPLYSNHCPPSEMYFTDFRVSLLSSQTHPMLPGQGMSERGRL